MFASKKTLHGDDSCIQIGRLVVEPRCSNAQPNLLQNLEQRAAVSKANASTWHYREFAISACQSVRLACSISGCNLWGQPPLLKPISCSRVLLRSYFYDAPFHNKELAYRIRMWAYADSKITLTTASSSRPGRSTFGHLFQARPIQININADASDTCSVPPAAKRLWAQPNSFDSSDPRRSAFLTTNVFHAVYMPANMQTHWAAS
jgi:hypothetical protein